MNWKGSQCRLSWSATSSLLRRQGRQNVPASVSHPDGSGYGNAARVSADKRKLQLQTAPNVRLNLAVERQLPWDTILSVAYAGSRGVHLWQPISEDNPDCPTSNTFIPQRCAGITALGSGTPIWGLALGKAPRLNPFFSNFSVFNTLSSSWFNALQVHVTKRLSLGLQYQVAYTYSKLMDDTEGLANSDTSNSAPGLTTDPFDPKVYWGPANFDVKSNLHAGVLYFFPKAGGDGVVGHILSGWWTGSIFSTQTGQPFSPLIAADREQSGIAGSKGGLERMSYVTPANLATLRLKRRRPV